MAESNAYFLVPKPQLPQFNIPLTTPETLKKTKTTTNPQAKGRLIIFRDSFAENWVQFLGYNFNQITYVFQNDLDPALIETDPPADMVVSEMVERVFNTEHPKKLMAKEALN
jgi:hypothetical protein